jgi:hypothetical protein
MDEIVAAELKAVPLGVENCPRDSKCQQRQCTWTIKLAVIDSKVDKAGFTNQAVKQDQKIDSSWRNFC